MTKCVEKRSESNKKNLGGERLKKLIRKWKDIDFFRFFFDSFLFFAGFSSFHPFFFSSSLLGPLFFSLSLCSLFSCFELYVNDLELEGFVRCECDTLYFLLDIIFLVFGRLNVMFKDYLKW